jgi:hypothetical protein
MSAQARSALAAFSNALEKALAWSLLAVGLYLVAFVDMTGTGSLYSSLAGLHESAQTAEESPNALRAIAVSARPRERAAPENRLFVVVDRELKEAEVSASIPAPDSFVGWPGTGLADSPADFKAGKNWKVGLRGRLRNFTVYGQGDQASVVGLATAQRSFALPQAAAIVPARGSAAEIGAMEATARPGLRSRVRGGGGYASSGSVRNAR